MFMDDNNRNRNNRLENTDVSSENQQGVQTNINSPRTLASYNNRDEETARELTTDANDGTRNVTNDDNDTDMFTGSAVGWSALVLSIISFFWLPIIFAGAGIVVGFIARNRGAETLGNIAIGAGVVSLILTLFVAPFMF